MNSGHALTDFFGQRKRRKLLNSLPNESQTCRREPDCLNATESAFIQLKSLFPAKELCYRLPSVILVHQVYSLLKNRTTVDKEINVLVERGVICLFKLGLKETTLIAIFSDDFNRHVLGRICPCQVEPKYEGWQDDSLSFAEAATKADVPSSSKSLLTIDKCNARIFSFEKSEKESKACQQSQAGVRFVHEVMPKIQDVSVGKELLQNEHNFRDEDLRTLVNVGLLVVRSVGSYWLSFPNAGEFMKHFSRGRAAVLRLIKKCKFSEILQPELEKRQLEKTAKYGIQYHMHDLIGGDFVDCIDTTSGMLLRISTPKKK